MGEGIASDRNSMHAFSALRSYINRRGNDHSGLSLVPVAMEVGEVGACSHQIKSRPSCEQIHKLSTSLR